MTRCSVCKHTRRRRIDTLLARGQTDREIAAAFGVALGPIGRHRRLHLDAKAREASTAREHEAGSSAAIDAVKQLEIDLDAHVSADPHDHRTTAGLARALLAHLRARMRSEIAAGPQLLDVLAFIVSDGLFDDIFEAIAPHSDAHEAMAMLFAELVLEGAKEYVPPTVPDSLAKLVTLLQGEADAAPAGRARASVSSALASVLSAQGRWRHAQAHWRPSAAEDS
jgi:hypothetical protein